MFRIIVHFHQAVIIGGISLWVYSQVIYCDTRVSAKCRVGADVYTLERASHRDNYVFLMWPTAGRRHGL